MHWNRLLLRWPLLTGTVQVFCQWKIYCDVVNFLSPLFHRTPDGRLWSCINLIVNAPQRFHGVNTLKYILRDQTLRNSKDQHYHRVPLKCSETMRPFRQQNKCIFWSWGTAPSVPSSRPPSTTQWAPRPQRAGPFWFNTSQTWTPGIY